MKTMILFLLLGFSVMISAQTNYQKIIEGKVDAAVMNAIYSPDGSKIAYTTSGYVGIWIFDIQSNTSIQLTEEIAAGFGFKWSSDSKSVLTRVAKYEKEKRFNAVKIFDVESKHSAQLNDYKTMMPYLPSWIDGDSKVYLPAKGSDETFISGKAKNSSINNNVFAFEKNNKIIVKNFADKSEKSFDVIKGAQYLNVSLSPDASKIVFEVLGGNMFAVNSDGTNLIDLGKGNRPRWSFDSKKIIYTIAEDDGHEFIASDIYKINSDGSQKINLTNTNDLIEMNPYFAPDGKSIVFDVVNDGSIYLMNIE